MAPAANGLKEKLDRFDDLYYNGTDFDSALAQSGLTEQDIGPIEDFRELVDFFKSFHDLIEALPSNEEKLEVLQTELELCKTLINKDDGLER